MTAPNQIASDDVVATYRESTLADWCATHGQPYSLLHPGHEKLFPMPYGGLSKQIGRASTFYGRVTDAALLPRRGYICTRDGALIYEGLSFRADVSADIIGRAFAGHSRSDAYSIRLPADIPTVEQECIYFGGLPNFGHFIFESLLRVAVAAQIPNAESLPLAVVSDLPKRYYEFLDLAGWAASRRILIDPEKPTRFTSVWHHTAPLRWSLNRSEGELVDSQVVWSPEDVQYVHDRVRASALSQKGAGSANREVLFISRGRQKWRRILNEDEVLTCVRQFGGQVVSLEGIPAQEQVQRLADARLLIIPLGASGAVSMFAPRDCAILEMTTPNILGYFGPMAFAGCLGQPHARLFGRIATKEETEGAGLEAASASRSDVDYWINCQVLSDFLRQILEQS